MLERRSPPRSPLDLLTRVAISRRAAVALTLGLTLAVAVGDYLTTAETAFTVFYLAPIGAAVWHVGPRWGLAIALLSTLGGLFTALFAEGHSAEPAFVVWNTVIEASIFLVVLGLVHALRSRADEAHAPSRVPPEPPVVTPPFGHHVGRAPTDVLAVCRRTAARIEPLAQRCGVTLAVTGDEVEARVDRPGLAEVVGTLLTNAIQASRPGGVVAVSVGREGDAVAITVRDAGPGGAASAPASVDDNVESASGVGDAPGLGLSIARSIVRDHGGRIDVTTSDADGSSFRVTLPT